jgi:predicted Zn-dependent protease
MRLMRRNGLVRTKGFAALAAAIAASTLLGCAVNPVTGDRQLMLISEAQEIELGREADQQIAAQMGLYDDPELAQYVSTVGRKLAAASERPQLPWTFRVLDDPVVNAFALPGGFVYVTRGIVAHLSSEAELAAVLGHEIGHVTARHGASRLSKAQLAGLGLGVGAVVSPEFARYAGLAESGLGLLFLKYSRDDERQADDLGLRYSISGGYDARQMPEVFAVLKRVSEGAGGGGIPGWLSTHPDPDARGERIRETLASSDVDFSRATVNRVGYVRHLDGMVFGEDPRQGLFREALFLHPELAFQVRFPAGWNVRNQRASVDAISSKNDAAAQLTLTPEGDPAAALQAFVAAEVITAGRAQRGQISGLSAVGADFEVAVEPALRGRVAFVRYGQNTYRLLAYTLSSEWSSYAGEAARFIESFGALTDRKVLAVEPARVDMVDLTKNLPLETFQRQYPSSVDLQTLALINHVGADGLLPGGQAAKRVVGGVEP